MTTYRRATGAAAAEVDGQIVIISPLDRRYFGLNRTGARIWELVPPTEPVTVDEIVATLTAEYQVDAEQCRSDVQAQIERLVAAGVVEAAGN